MVTSRLTNNKLLAFVISKPAGLVIFAYLIWLLGSFRLLNYQNHWAIGLLFLCAIIAGVFFCRNFFLDTELKLKKDKKQSKQHLSLFKKLLVVELVWLGIYFLYLWIRSNSAAINGTERFMDMALLSAAGKTSYFPFLDPWYAGKTINYYYYGSYLMSLISNLSKTPYALAYNFSLGLLFSQSILLAGAFVKSITGSKWWALIAAFLITSAGTLFFAGCTINASLATPIGTCSYASSTRLYSPSYIINEIPSYSFTVGDLHAHLLALPLFLFGLILLYFLAESKKPKILLLLLLAVSMASSGMINAWDFVTLLALLVVLCLVKFFQQIKLESSFFKGLKATWPWALSVIGVLLLAFCLMWPNLRSFQSPVLGLGFIPSFVAAHKLTNVQWPTPALALAGMWGVFISGIIWFLVAKRKSLADHPFELMLTIVSLGILIGIEFLFVRDIYSIANPPYFRANTTFKFGYHAWTMLCLVFVLFMANLYKRKENQKHTPARWWAIILTLLAVIGGLFYPYQAVQQFYSSNSAAAKTLDGSEWMKDFDNYKYKNDYAVVNYINKNFPNRVVIAEAVGDSYTQFSRIATFSGMITPIGWQTHEWTWRFSYKAPSSGPINQTVETGWGAVSAIAQDMQMLYNTPSPQVAQALINKYNISYIYVGDLERNTYPSLDEQKFSALGHIEFQYGNSKLFKVN